MDSLGRASQFAVARVAHSLSWSLFALGIAFLLSNELANIPSDSTQLKLLVVGSLTLGVSHGALDLELGKRIFRKESFWWIRFAVGYLAMIILGGGLWLLDRTTLFIMFLLVSSVHFGSAPPYIRHAAPAIAYLFVPLVGSLTLVIPCYFFRDDVSLIFGHLGLNHAVLPLTALDRWPAVVLIGILVLTFGIGCVSRAMPGCTWTHLDFLWWVEFLAMVLLFAAVPPILAFTIFFVGLHSLRHIFFLSEHLWGLPIKLAVKRSLLCSLPMTLATVLVAMLLFFTPSLMSLESRTLNIIFGGFVILTFPHIVVTSRYSLQKRHCA